MTLALAGLAGRGGGGGGGSGGGGGGGGGGSTASATARGALSQAKQVQASFVRCQSHLHAPSGAVMVHRNTVTRTHFPDERTKSKNRRTPGSFSVSMKPECHSPLLYTATPSTGTEAL